MPDPRDTLTADSGCAPTRAGLSALFAAALQVTVFFVSAFTLHVPAFSMNDDPGMSLIASGFWFGAPSPEQVLNSIFLSYPLSWLYAAFPAIPWYGLQLYLAHLAAWLAIAYCLLGGARRLEIGFSLLCVQAAFGAQILMNLNASSTALLLGVAAVFLHAARLLNDRQPAWLSVLAGGMLGFSGCIRMQMHVFGAVAFTLPILLICWRKLSPADNARFALSACGLLILAHAAQALHYSFDPRWQSYFEFENLRYKIHDGPEMEWDGELASLIAKAGWSRTDFEMFQSYFIADRGKFSVAALETILSGRGLRDYPAANRKAAAKKVWDVHGVRIEFVLALLAVCCIYLPAAGRPAATTAVWQITLMFALGTFIRFPIRAAIPGFISTSLAVLLVALVEAGRENDPRAALRLRASLAALFALSLRFVTFEPIEGPEADRLASHRNFVEGVEALERLDQSGIFVHWMGSLKLERISPIGSTAGLPALKHLGIGWHLNSPPALDRAHELGIDDIHRAIANDPRVYLVASERLARLFERYYQERYGQPVQLHRIESVGELAVFHNRAAGPLNP